MRPEERIALERGDVDRALRQASIRRVYPEGELKLTGKQAGSLRTVPLPFRAVEALSSLSARLDTPLLFPGRAGGFLNLSNFRALDWKPALRAAGGGAHVAVRAPSHLCVVVDQRGSRAVQVGRG